MVPRRARAVEWGELEATPARSVKAYRVDDARIRVLSQEEIQNVLGDTRGDVALCCRVTLLLEAGINPTEQPKSNSPKSPQVVDMENRPRKDPA